MRKHFLLMFCMFVFSATASFANERTENNGNLILKNIPIIPESIKSDLTQYQNVRSAPFRGFNNEGNEIFITTRFGNVSQLHKVRKKGGAREQITFFEEPIGSISRKPGGQLIAFTMDAGGSENNQIFVLDPKNGSSQMLSDGQSRNGGPLWEKNGSRIAYQSTRRNGQSNDVWMMDSKNIDSAEMILESPDGTWWGPSDWSKDGKKILIQNYISITNAKAYLLDIESKKKEMILGSDSTESYNAILSFDRSQKGVFFLTNEFGEFNQLAHKDLATNKISILTKDIPWDIGGFAISTDYKRVAFTVNEGGMGSLYLMDAESKKYRKVKSIPIGLIGGIEFSEDGTKLGLTINKIGRAHV